MSERLTCSERGTWGVRLPVSEWRNMPTGVVIPWFDTENNVCGPDIACMMRT